MKKFTTSLRLRLLSFIYREFFFNSSDWFHGSALAARRTQILPMNQHAMVDNVWNETK
jgi:hypothetical protein